jgi:hypothetical protein
VSELGGVAAFTQPAGGAAASGGGGTGDFVGPGSALDGSIVLFDGPSGKLGKDAAVVLSAFAKTLLDDASAGAALTTLGVSAFVQTILEDADAATVRATVGLSLPLAVGSGGTGATTLTAHGVLLGNGTGAVAVTGAGTAGQVLTSNGAAADPTFQTLAAGGDFVGPGSATDNAIVRFDATTGKLGQNSILSIADTDALSTPALALGTDLNTGVSWVAGADKVSLVAGGVEVLRANTVASGQNYVNVTPGSSNTGPTIAAAGAGSNLDLSLATTGTGQVLIPAGTVAKPGIGFAGTNTTGLSLSGTNLFLNIAGVAQFLVAGTAGARLASGGVWSWASGTLDGAGPDTGISRAGAADLAFGSGTAGNATATLKFGNARCRGYTTTAAAATTTEYPTDKDWGVHRNSNTAAVHLVYNDGGTMKSVQLT